VCVWGSCSRAAVCASKGTMGSMYICMHSDIHVNTHTHIQHVVLRVRRLCSGTRPAHRTGCGTVQANNNSANNYNYNIVRGEKLQLHGLLGT
jgi:hypothetical protein